MKKKNRSVIFKLLHYGEVSGVYGSLPGCGHHQLCHHRGSAIDLAELMLNFPSNIIIVIIR